MQPTTVDGGGVSWENTSFQFGLQKREEVITVVGEKEQILEGNERVSA